MSDGKKRPADETDKDENKAPKLESPDLELVHRMRKRALDEGIERMQLAYALRKRELDTLSGFVRALEGNIEDSQNTLAWYDRVLREKMCIALMHVYPYDATYLEMHWDSLWTQVKEMRSSSMESYTAVGGLIKLLDMVLKLSPFALTCDEISTVCDSVSYWVGIERDGGHVVPRIAACDAHLGAVYNILDGWREKEKK